MTMMGSAVLGYLLNEIGGGFFDLSVVGHKGSGGFVRQDWGPRFD